MPQLVDFLFYVYYFCLKHSADNAFILYSTFVMIKAQYSKKQLGYHPQHSVSFYYYNTAEHGKVTLTVKISKH